MKEKHIIVSWCFNIYKYNGQDSDVNIKERNVNKSNWLQAFCSLHVNCAYTVKDFFINIMISRSGTLQKIQRYIRKANKEIKME